MASPTSRPPGARLHVVAALVAAAAAPALLASCGDEGGPGSGRGEVMATTPKATTSAAPTPPATPRAASGAATLPNAVTAGGATATPGEAVIGTVAIASGRGAVAVAGGGDERGLTLAWSPGGEIAPKDASGAGPIPAWAILHTGTDERGGPVVTYPRCADELVTSCEVYVWSAATRREQRLDAVSIDGLGETEASMDRGAVTVVRELMQDETLDRKYLRARVSFRVSPLLAHARAGARTVEEHEVLREQGGRGISLDGGRIGFAHTETESTPWTLGTCVVTSARVRDLAGRTLYDRPFRCDERGPRITGTQLDGDRFRWALVRADGSATAFEADVRTGRTRSAALPIPIVDWAPTDGDGGLALRGNGCGPADTGGAERAGRCRVWTVTGLRYR